MLCNDGHEPLQTSQDRTMNNDGPRWRLVGVRGLLRGAILQVEALRQLEVELDRRALERAAEGVADLDVDLGAVERAVAGVELPLPRVLGIERLLELVFGLVPRLDCAEVVVRPCRELELELKAEEAVDVLHEVEEGVDLLFNLRAEV